MTKAESRLREAVEHGYPHHTLTIEDGRGLVAEFDRLRQWEVVGREWLDKTDWMQNKDAPWRWLGKHRADALREEIDRLRAAVQHEADCVEAAKAEIDRLTRELDELSDEVALKSACINGMSQATDKLAGERDAMAKALRGMLALEQENLRGDDDIDICYEVQQARAALAQIEQERSEQAKEGA